jgi:hypothetical protein
MRLILTGGVEEFATRTRAFLASELDRNVLATVTAEICASPAAVPPVLAYALGDGDAVTAAALRTPPWPMLAAGFADLGLAARLLDAWLPADPSASGAPGSAQPRRVHGRRPPRRLPPAAGPARARSRR